LLYVFKTISYINCGRTYLHGIDKGVVELNLNQNQAEIDRQLAKLPVAHGARFDSNEQEHKPRCIPETRIDVLEQISAWSQQQDRPIYWLSGVAGSGKSTISRTVAEKFWKEGCLAGSFFFSRGRGDLASAAKFVTTLARQLASSQPDLRAKYSETIEKNEEILSQGLGSQWKELIQKPLQEAFHVNARRKLLFVIDALDECDRDEDIQLLLRLLFTLKEHNAMNLRIFLTSRPEIIIKHGFTKAPDILHKDLNLGDVPRYIAEQDILKYLRTELTTLCKERALTDWPSTEEFNELLKKCDALFIYASTACRFIADPADSPRDRLYILLQDGSDDGLNLPDLDSMYLKVLDYSYLKNKKGIARTRLFDRFHRVIAPFLMLRDALSAPALSSLLDIELEDVLTSFDPLQSLIYVPRDNQSHLRTLHPSFRDLLSNKRRYGDSQFGVDIEETNLTLVRSCIKALSQFLSNDLCALKQPGIKLSEISRSIIDACLPQHIQYSCLYWVDHLEQIGASRRKDAGMCDGGAIHIFFQKHFLQWLEAMSLLRRLREGVLMFTRLETLLEVSR
jgi:NACHT domain